MQGDGSGAIHAAETSACLLDACVRVSICHAAWRAPCAAMHSHMHTHYHHRSIHKWQQTSSTAAQHHIHIHVLQHAQRTHRFVATKATRRKCRCAIADVNSSSLQCCSMKTCCMPSWRTYACLVFHDMTTTNQDQNPQPAPLMPKTLSQRTHRLPVPMHP